MISNEIAKITKYKVVKGKQIKVKESFYKDNKLIKEINHETK